MPTSPSSSVASYRLITRVIYFALFSTVGLYWIVVEMLRAGAEVHDLGLVKPVFLLAAGVAAAVILILRFSRIAPLLVDTTGKLKERLTHLLCYYLICHALSEAVALYGFVIRLLGGSRVDAAPFFAGAVILFLLSYPRQPQTSAGQDEYH